MTKDKDIQSLAEHIKREDGKVDVLINNAGVNTYPEHSSASIRQMLDVNYRGMLKMCQAFIPLLSQDGRIVNLSSVASGLQIYSKDVQARFRDSNMTLEDVEQLAREYEVTERTMQSRYRITDIDTGHW